MAVLSEQRILAEAQPQAPVFDHAIHGVSIDLTEGPRSVLHCVELYEAHGSIVLESVGKLPIARARAEADAELLLERGRQRWGDARGKIANKEGIAGWVLID